MRTEQYHIDGMSCAACSSAVERVTRKLGGVEDSNVNLTTNRMVITYDEDQVTSGMICEAVSRQDTAPAFWRRNRTGKRRKRNGSSRRSICSPPETV